MTNASPIIKKGRKFDQVLDGAREVFMKHGFEGASVDDIAKTAGVSKATLYSYFPDKRLLFAEVAKCECMRQADSAMELLGENLAPRIVLKEAGQRIIDFSLTDFGQSMYRMCVAESSRFPELGERFYTSGPKLVQERLSDYLTEAMAEGLLQIPNIPLAADQFTELCKATFFSKLTCGVQTEFTKAETDTVLDGAIDMFLARYGV